MSYFDKVLYVGFSDRYSNAEDPRLLGFAIPISDTVAFRKRKATVDNWRSDTITPVKLLNIPRYGFKIVDSVSRYSTSNKLFRVQDPAGFELEISAKNLFEILKTCTVSQGQIMDKMVWGPNTNQLSAEHSIEYQEAQKPKIAMRNVPGAMFKNKLGNTYYRYEGKFAYNILNSALDRVDPNGYYYRSHLNTDYSKVVTSMNSTVIRVQDRPADVYTAWYLNTDIAKALKFNPKPEIIIRKSYLKDLLPLDDDDPTIPSFTIPRGEILMGTVRCSMTTVNYNSKYALFDTKIESMSRDWTQAEFDVAFKLYDGGVDMSYYGTTKVNPITYIDSYK